MVYPSARYISAAVAFIALQPQQAVASSLKDDPITTCPSFNINDEFFQGRGSEIKDNPCTSTMPGSSSHRKLETSSNADIAMLETHFGTKMEMKLKNLPTSAMHTPSPWGGSYWYTNKDSINYEWSKGQPSAAEKYAKAFGLDTVVFMDNISAQNGIHSKRDGGVCSEDGQCMPGSICAKRTKQSYGYCIDIWNGLGHAWAPAAILEKEPNCPVTYNGVTFQPMDIKALVTDVYAGADVPNVFTGMRYHGDEDSIDEYGSHTSDAYRDLNPGFFHIASANLLGKLNTTFIIDRDAGVVVSNNPVRGFNVTETKPMTLEETAKTYYRQETYPWNDDAKSIVYVMSSLSWVNETYIDGGLVASGRIDEVTMKKTYEYLLEMDDTGSIIGGEWLKESNNNHPDFLWFPIAKPAADTKTDFGLSYANVTMLLEKAVACTP